MVVLLLHIPCAEVLEPSCYQSYDKPNKEIMCRKCFEIVVLINNNKSFRKVIRLQHFGVIYKIVNIPANR